MAYGNFKTLEEVASKFGIRRSFIEFTEETKFTTEELFFRYIKRNLSNHSSYVSENSICEMLIYPILSIVIDVHNLPIWSHVRFDISEEDGLTGIPDFLIAPVAETGIGYSHPVICIAEVKKENFEEGWTQALCEMIAAQRLNNNSQKPIYGIATSGEIWKFSKLIDKQFIIDPRPYSAPLNLQQVLDVLNWFLGEAKKQLDN